MTAEGMNHTGRVGAEASFDSAVEAARICAINIIGQINAATGGDLEKVKRIVRLGGFVASTDGFTDQHKVINSASDLMQEVFGDKGRHARAAVGTNALPLGATVEIDAIVELG